MNQKPFILALMMSSERRKFKHSFLFKTSAEMKRCAKCRRRLLVLVFPIFSSSPVVVSDLTLRVSQDSGFLHTLGGLSCPSGPLPVLLFPLCCRVCGLTLEETDLEGDKVEGEGESEGDGGQVTHFLM